MICNSDRGDTGIGLGVPRGLEAQVVRSFRYNTCITGGFILRGSKLKANR